MSRKGRKGRKKSKRAPATRQATSLLRRAPTAYGTVVESLERDLAALDERRAHLVAAIAAFQALSSRGGPRE